jgi:hypothetical protein
MRKNLSLVLQLPSLPFSTETAHLAFHPIVPYRHRTSHTQSGSALLVAVYSAILHSLAVALPTRNREVIVSNFGRGTDYPE